MACFSDAQLSGSFAYIIITITIVRCERYEATRPRSGIVGAGLSPLTRISFGLSGAALGLKRRPLQEIDWDEPLEHHHRT